MKRYTICLSTLLVLSIAMATTMVNAQEKVDPFVKRGEGTVSHHEFDALMHRIPAADRAPFLRDAKRFEKVVSDLLIQKQLAEEAKKAGFADQEIIRTRMALAATAELAKAWLEHYIEDQGDARYEELAREQYLLEPEKYLSRPAIDVSHILISVEQRDKDSALELANELRAKLLADPDQWDAFVMTYSEDPAVSGNGGSYKGVKKGDMVKRFEDKAFSLENGEISEPVLTQYGYHIIRLDGQHAAEQLPFEAVKDRLVERQKNIHKDRLRVDYVTQFTSLNTEMTEEQLRLALERYFDEETLSSPETTE